MKNTLLNSLTPKEPKFYPLLRELANISLQAAEQLVACIEANNQEGAVAIHQKIKDLEHAGDQLTNKIFDELNTTFITPFDREDINSLANKLDDVTDDIYGCSKRILFYKPKQLPKAALDLANMIKEAAKCILNAVEELDVLKKSSTRIKQYCKELHNIENRADEVYQVFITDLFAEETDVVEIIKLKEIVYVLEMTTDEADHVGKIIKTIIVKYA
jgi:predicted phosphate transport protein (TIGR00153 family)